MILNDLERQNREFYGFFCDFALRHKAISVSYTHLTLPTNREV